MSEHRTRLDDSIADIGLGAVLIVVALMIVAPAMAALSSGYFRSRGLDLGCAIQSAGGMFLALFGVRFLARGLIGLFRR